MKNKTRILIPKFKLDTDPSRYGPLFFLAGPVRGGGDWQKEAAELIDAALPESQIAIPYYHQSKEPFPLIEQAVKGNPLEVYGRQRDWERYHMDIAARSGCLIFWLPEESKEFPRPSDSGPYACDSRGEVGEWRGMMAHDPTYHVAVGGQAGFHSIDLIQRDFTHALKLSQQFPLHWKLEETVRAALWIATLPYRAVVYK